MARIRITAQQLPDRHFFIRLSYKTAIVTQTLLRPGKGGRMARIKAAYFGFVRYCDAQQFARQIRGRFPASRLQVRESKRLDLPYEVKVCHSYAEELAWEMTSQLSPTSAAIAQHIAQAQARQARLDALPPVGEFVDRSAAPINRSRPKTATVGRYTVSIE